MANFSQETSELSSKYVQPTSRYNWSKVRQYTEEKFLTFETYKRKRKGHFREGNAEWLEITANVEYRPDLVSNELFGTPDLWWRIMEHNGMKDIMEFRSGVNIQIPGNILL